MTDVEIDISDEDYEMLKAYQKELGFDTLNDLIVYILERKLKRGLFEKNI